MPPWLVPETAPPPHPDRWRVGHHQGGGAPRSEGRMSGAFEAIRCWRLGGERGDADVAADALSSDVQLISPITDQFRFVGREQVRSLLGVALGLIEEIRYTDELSDGRTVALFYSARIGDVRLEEAQRLRPARTISSVRSPSSCAHCPASPASRVILGPGSRGRTVGPGWHARSPSPEGYCTAWPRSENAESSREPPRVSRLGSPLSVGRQRRAENSAPRVPRFGPPGKGVKPHNGDSAFGRYQVRLGNCRTETPSGGSSARTRMTCTATNGSGP